MRQEPGLGGIARLLERPTEDGSAVMLTRVGRVPAAESTFSADSLTVSVQPQCAIARITICTRVKSPKHWQPHHCVDAALGAAVPCRV